MKWYQDTLSRRYAIWGTLFGLVIPVAATLVEVVTRGLPFVPQSLVAVQRDEPLLWLSYTAPFILGYLAVNLGAQRSMALIVERGKKEWEATFDALSDLVFVTDPAGRILRCNHAVVDRLNTRYINVIGKPISEVLGSNQPEDIEKFSDGKNGFSWLGRLYEVSTVPIDVDQAEPRNLFILRDITRRKQAEAALEQSESLFRGLFDLSPDAVVLIDPHDSKVSWPIIDCNKAAGVMNGYQREELIGHSIDILNVSRGTEAERGAYLSQLRAVENLKLETQHRRKNGEVFPVEVSTRLITIGERELVIGIDRDITDRKRMDEKLAKSEAELRALFGAMQDVVMVFDREGRYVQIAPTSTEMLYQSPEEMLGKTVFDVLAPALAQKIHAAIQEVLRTRKLVHVEYSLPVANSEEDVWKDAAVTPLTYDTVFWIARDITARKRVEAELIQEKQFQEALIHHSPTSIIVLDNQGNIISCNPAFEQLYGYTATEAVGKNLDSLITTPETLEQASTYTQQALSGLVHGFGKRRRKDGSFASVEIFGVPLIVGEERAGALVIYHDITELDRARTEAEEANRAKSEFLANMSHEIRTPMNGVMGMLELALETQLTTEQRDYLETSLHSAEALLALLNDILDFSKIEAGRLQLEKINFNLRNTVEDVAYTLAARAQEKGLEIACLIHPDVSSNLRGDPGRLRQVLVNLVGNAIKFTHHGEIVIQAESIEENQSHALVHFAVQDTGVGIPLERQAAIFDRFTQADGSTTRKFGGTGLGLTICKQLVEAMGGKIGVGSRPGVGSTFWFDISFEKQPRGRQGTAPLSPIGPVNLGAARILVVDDNQTNRLVLMKNVEAMGCRVDAVSSGAKTLESLRNAQRGGEPYHVVLLDMQMPGMDGEQTARAIKSDPAVKEVKIIILTSMGHRGDAARMEALGCSGYLLKPVKQQMLFDATMAVLGREKEADQALITRHVLSEQRKFGLRLLLAEDNPINQKVAVAVLQKAGYSVDTVDNGTDAVIKAKANQYNAILMDVQMPGTDGFEATQQIREWEKDQNVHIPIIAMTAHAMKGDRERCLEAGMDDYVTKPLQPPVLISALNRWIQADTPTNADQQVQDYSSQPDPFSIELDDGMFGEFAAAPTPVPPPAPERRVVSSANSPPVDLPSAIARFDDDREFVLSIIRDYRDQLPERLKEIRHSLRNGDANSLCRIAHNLKGVSLNISAAPIAQAALDIEQSALHDNLRGTADLVTKLEAEVARFEEYIASMNS
jgi:PAS domain S-box-containing protein